MAAMAAFNDTTGSVTIRAQLKDSGTVTDEAKSGG
jgi:hypothetical protein